MILISGYYFLEPKLLFEYANVCEYPRVNLFIEFNSVNIINLFKIINKLRYYIK